MGHVPGVNFFLISQSPFQISLHYQGVQGPVSSIDRFCLSNCILRLRLRRLRRLRLRLSIICHLIGSYTIYHNVSIYHSIIELTRPTKLTKFRQISNKNSIIQYITRSTIQRLTLLHSDWLKYFKHSIILIPATHTIQNPPRWTTIL